MPKTSTLALLAVIVGLVMFVGAMQALEAAVRSTNFGG